jgi:hypothetical protein
VWVEVLPAAEIVHTLDEDQALEGLPFMPEMLRHCGQRHRVALRAERTCLTPPEVPFRQLRNAVVLEGLRCDGSLHGDCDLGCMFLWKEAWLRPVGAGAGSPAPLDITGAAGPEATPALRATLADDPAHFFCQATELPRATEPGEPAWKPGQYVHLVRVRTLTLRDLVVQFGRPVARRLRWFVASLDPRPKPRPALIESHLGLQPGEWVEVRSREEIRRTLDAHGAHTGLAFSTDMYRLSGRRMRVERRLAHVVVEATGKLQAVRDTVILEGSYCERYRGCARGMPIFWREAWLKRVGPPPDKDAGASGRPTDQAA